MLHDGIYEEDEQLDKWLSFAASHEVPEDSHLNFYDGLFDELATLLGGNFVAELGRSLEARRQQKLIDLVGLKYAVQVQVDRNNTSVSMPGTIIGQNDFGAYIVELATGEKYQTVSDAIHVNLRYVRDAICAANRKKPSNSSTKF